MLLADGGEAFGDILLFKHYMAAWTPTDDQRSFRAEERREV